ncbi:MAG TPA: hypothetical protein VD966_00505, partial [Pyrinomonadaceae bacterium]|nr:hypothetical protein [Pyrinomonadaceae bacterium]
MSSDNGQDRTQPSPTLKGDYAPTEFLPASEYPTVIPPTVPARADDFDGLSEQALIGDQMTPDWKAHQESSTKGSAGGFPGRVAPGRALKIVLAVVLTLLVLGVASVLVWSRFNRERGSRNQLSDAVTATGPSSERSLNYWLTVQKMR